MSEYELNEYELVVTGEVREVYLVTAKTPEQAREMFENGDLQTPAVSEVTSVHSVEVREQS